MKLIIDIPEEKYNDILHTHVNMRGIVGNAVAIGTPIPDNATNGDMLKAMFPDGVKTSIAYPRDVSKEWMNAPYQKGGKGWS